jgi:transposase
MAKKKKVSLEIINPHTAGIDVGSRSHFVAIGQGKEDLREFGVYSEDLKALASWLLENKVVTVAMESTGTYWQNLYAALQEVGLKVTLVNGKFAKNIHGKKTDVKDCQWLQKLHTLGLLTGSFLPDSATEQLRTYCRHRSNLVDTAADTTRKMQKYLRLLNLRLDVVVRDVTGETGLAITQAVCKGETSAEALASLRHYNCRKSKEEIAKALQSNGRKDYLFALTQEFELYKILQEKIIQCDHSIEQLINAQINLDESKKELKVGAKPHKRVNKNAPKNIDINLVAYQYFDGVDLMAIEGVSHGTVMTLMSEVGYEGLKKFASAKQFTSWLRLSPNNKISGGRILSNRIPKGSNRLKIALRNTANAVGNLKDTHLSNFFKRICFRRGRAAAISATARKLAVIIWNMVVKGIAYNPPTQYEFLDQKRKRKVQEMKKLITKFNLTSTELGLITS